MKIDNFQGEAHHDLVRDVRQNKGSILKVTEKKYSLPLKIGQTVCDNECSKGERGVHPAAEERDCGEESTGGEMSHTGQTCFHALYTVLGDLPAIGWFMVVGALLAIL